MFISFYLKFYFGLENFKTIYHRPDSDCWVITQFQNINANLFHLKFFINDVNKVIIVIFLLVFQKKEAEQPKQEVVEEEEEVVVHEDNEWGWHPSRKTQQIPHS